MGWIKRNLYFVIGAAIALVLLGVAGWYCYSDLELNNKDLDDLNQAYTDLAALSKQNPHPGSGNIDNVKLAKEQQQDLRGYIDSARKFFQPIEPIPNVARPSDRDFSAALSRTLDQLRRDGSAVSVTLPVDYSFSFQAQRQKVSFRPGSLQPLATQLGEVKAICDVLFAAKVNSLDILKREHTADDDATTTGTDYINDKSVTNDLAVISPYEISIRCFSPELAGVLSGFAGSRNGIVVKSINVESAAAAAEAMAGGANAGQFSTAANPGAAPARFGVPVTTAGIARAGVTRGLPIVLDERQLKVTLALVVIKPVAPQTKK
jgi:hypothetical protein